MFLLRNAQASEEDEGKQNPVDISIQLDSPQSTQNTLPITYWEA